MLDKKLLLLGYLRCGSMHGYQINELIDAHLGTSVRLTKPTAYRLLKQMAEDGLIDSHDERVGNRPIRRVFTITPEGERVFQESLRQCLADYALPDYEGIICISFLNEISREEAIPLLEKRVQFISEMLEQIEVQAAHQNDRINLVIEHHRRHLQLDLDWLQEVMDYEIRTEMNETTRGSY